MKIEIFSDAKTTCQNNKNILIYSHTEGYRSGHNGADSKSVRGQPHVGSNPTLSAKRELHTLTILVSVLFSLCGIALEW